MNDRSEGHNNACDEDNDADNRHPVGEGRRHKQETAYSASNECCAGDARKFGPVGGRRGGVMIAMKQAHIARDDLVDAKPGNEQASNGGDDETQELVHETVLSCTSGLIGASMLLRALQCKRGVVCCPSCAYPRSRTMARTTASAASEVLVAS